MNTLSPREIARLIDISGVRTDVTLAEVEKIAQVARQFGFICAFAMPCFTKKLVELLADRADILVGGVVGFPSGAETSTMKAATARELLAMGVDEFDMVINVGALKSGDDELVRRDIQAVIEAVEGKPVKTILEIAYLTDDEIARASLLAAQAGATYIKTGTGWASKPTTVQTIALIKRTIGDSALIKAAGGIRDLDTLLAMVDAGCSRFGIGIHSAIKIMEELHQRLGLEISTPIAAAANDNY